MTSWPTEHRFLAITRLHAGGKYDEVFEILLNTHISLLPNCVCSVCGLAPLKEAEYE
jgi:hypothetical protein